MKALLTILAFFLCLPLNAALKVALIGDSITEDGGYQRELQKQLPNYIIHNYGIAGESSKKIRQRVRARGSDLKNKIAGIWEYDMIIVLAGINNVTEPKQVKRDLQAIYDLAKQNPDKHTRVIAMTLTPWKGYSTWSPYKQFLTMEINHFITQEAHNVDQVIELYSALGDLRDPERMHPNFHTNGDPLHPRGEGQVAIAWELMEKVFIPLGALAWQDTQAYF